jgi:SAM-dependent methyltransferase
LHENERLSRFHRANKDEEDTGIHWVIERPPTKSGTEIAILANTPIAPALSALQPVLVCPICRSDLQWHDDALRCGRCEEDYAVVDGVPLFGLFGTASDFSVQSEAGQSYEHKFTGETAPQLYDRQFVQEPHKKGRTDRELKILSSHLSHFESVGRILNIPCGGGRLSRPLAQACSLLVEADVALPQVRFAREHGDYTGVEQAAWMTASGFHLPCADKEFDGVVCARLIHHFSQPDDHARLLSELCRVARRFVMNTGLIDKMVQPHGFELKTTLSVSPFGSRHRYALLTAS